MATLFEMVEVILEETVEASVAKAMEEGAETEVIQAALAEVINNENVNVEVETEVKQKINSLLFVFWKAKFRTKMIRTESFYEDREFPGKFFRQALLEVTFIAHTSSLAMMKSVGLCDSFGTQYFIQMRCLLWTASQWNCSL